jgi:hypothetical protein
MKKNYFKIKAATFIATALLLSGTSFAQLTTLTFSYGSVANTNTGTIDSFTVPACVTDMTIEVRGAQGGDGSGGTGGLGARMIGVFTVTPGQVLRYLVGKCPGNISGGGFTFPGGGGGSFVALGPALSTSTPMIVAGGGGGGYNSTSGTGAPITTSGTGPLPGTLGNGAPANSCGGGGGGFYTSGGTDINYSFFGGQGFLQGGTGGLPNSTYITTYQPGGFGGGAPANYVGSCNYRAGSGGGYSGGSAVGVALIDIGNAGGSFNAGTSQTNTAAFNTGHGVIIFKFTPGAPIVASASPTSICTGGAATLIASGVSTYTWSSSSNATSLTVNPSTTTSYTVSGTNSSGCITSSVLTVTVNAGTPTLSVISSTNSLCLGKSATLTASGAYNYTWTNGVTNGVSFFPTTTNNYTVTGANGCGTSTAISGITVAPLSVSMIVTPTVVCAGNTATINVSAAASSYTFLIPSPASGSSNSIIVSPQVNSTYTVAVSDGTCGGTATVALATLQVPTLTSVSSSTAICEGASVNLSVSGGLSYTWTPGPVTGSAITVSPLIPTLYSVIGSNAAGCFGNSSQVIIVSPSPTVNVTSADPVICSGSSTTLTASGTSNAYAWSSGGTANVEVVSPLTTNVYSVVGTNTVNQCSRTVTIQVNVYTPSVSITGNSVICNGASGNFTASGATNYTWNPGGTTFPNTSLSPNVTTTYTVSSITSTNNINCAANNTFQVIVNQNPTVIATSARPEICKNESVTITASGATSYLWSGAQTTASITATSSLITTMFFTVTGTNAQGCSTSTVVQVKVNSCNSIVESNMANNKLSIYPNPSKGDFSIQFGAAINLNLVNELGQLIKVINLNEKNAYSYKVSDLSNGVYFITGESANGKLTQKIIVNN